MTETHTVHQHRDAVHLGRYGVDVSGAPVCSNHSQTLFTGLAMLRNRNVVTV